MVDPCASNSDLKMGILRKSHEEKEISFSGESKDWEEFRTNVNNDLENKEMQWIICGAQAIAKHFQSIVEARTTDKSLQGTPMQTDLTTFPDKQIKKVTERGQVINAEA